MTKEMGFWIRQSWVLILISPLPGTLGKLLNLSWPQVPSLEKRNNAYAALNVECVWRWDFFVLRLSPLWWSEKLPSEAPLPSALLWFSPPSHSPLHTRCRRQKHKAKASMSRNTTQAFSPVSLMPNCLKNSQQKKYWRETFYEIENLMTKQFSHDIFFHQ